MIAKILFSTVLSFKTISLVEGRYSRIMRFHCTLSGDFIPSLAHIMAIDLVVEDAMKREG